MPLHDYYFRRETRQGAKAGNVNHALRQLEMRAGVPSVFMILDADSQFLSRAVIQQHLDL